MDYKKGDVVVLKSGGPTMTIEKIGPRNSSNLEIVANCVWFEGEQVKSDKFLLETLVLVSDDIIKNEVNITDKKIGF